MVDRPLHRRTVLASMAASAFVPQAASAADVINLKWRNLLPEGEVIIPNGLQEFIDHESAPLARQQPLSSGVRPDWNGHIVRLSGFIIPIDHKGTGVVAFILAPYVGACIHVPPPPANQLVFVTTKDPYESAGLFEAVSVTGMFGVSSISTQLADVGYTLSADRIESHRV